VAAQGGSTTSNRAAHGVARVRRDWQAMTSEQRLTAIAAAGLFVSMFLPWYKKSAFSGGRVVENTLSAFGVFSFVEAAVLLVAVAVLVMVFARAERRAFHLPGGDGPVIVAAGAWVCVLLIWRLFDKPSVAGLRGGTAGIEWGVFVALAAAGLLVYAGTRVRAAHRPEPPLPGTRRSDAAGPGADIVLPDERPHLAATEVLDRDRPGPAPDRRGPRPAD
jgi:hypothetical protein